MIPYILELPTPLEKALIQIIPILELEIFVKPPPPEKTPRLTCYDIVND